jgi:hypothetical protein
MPPAAEAVICGIQLIQKFQNAHSLVNICCELRMAGDLVNQNAAGSPSASQMV